MKKSYLILVFCLFIFKDTFSQSSFQGKIADNYFIGLQQAFNKDFLFCTYSNNNSPGKIAFSRITKNGEVIWSKKYYNESLSDAVFAATKSNGFVFSMMYINSNNLIVFSVTKCNKNGNVIWSKTYNTNTKYESSTYTGPLICITFSENIYVAINNGHEFFQITKLDKNGNVLWCNRYADITGLFNANVNITSGNDDGLLVSRLVGNCEGYCTTGKLQKLDKNGNTVFAKLFDGPIWSAYPLLSYYEDDSLYVLGYVSEDYLSPDYKKRYYYWKYSTMTNSGSAVLIPYDFVSLKEYFKKNKIVLAQGKTISNYYDGDWIINSDWSLINLKQQSSVVSVNKYDSLNRLCPDYEPLPYIESILKADVPKDEPSYKQTARGIISSKFTINVFDYSLPIKIICSGAEPQKFSKANNTISAAFNNISLYPNPSSNLITVKGIKEKTVITVADINNRILKQYTTTSSSLQIDISAFAAGAYIIRLNDGRKIVSKTFIKN